MQNVQHTKIGYTVPTMLFIASMFMMTSLAIFCGIVYVHNYQAKPLPKKPNGSLVNIGAMSTEAIEATYGPVNQKALLETKEGLFARIRAARQGCSPCVPQRQQACYSQQQRFYTTSSSWCATTRPVVVPNYQPVYPQPYQPSPTPVGPAPSYVQPNPLKIQPSSESNCVDGSCNQQASIQSSVPSPPEVTEGFYVLAIKPSL